MTDTTRIKLLVGVLVITFGYWIWTWISGWGLVTVRAYDQSFAKIQRSIERQGGIKIISNVPPETLLSMEVVRVSAADAVDVLAARVDGRWAVTYLAAPSKSELSGAMQSVMSPDDNSAYRTLRTRGGGMGGFDMVPDVRRVKWNVSPMEEQTLEAYLDQFVQKTGASVVFPSEWNPAVAKQPKSGVAGSALREMVKSAGGQVDEVFAIVVRPEGSGGDRGFGGEGEGSWGSGNVTRGGPPPSGGGSQRSEAPSGSSSAGTPTQVRNAEGGRNNPEWARERMMAQIEQLPAAEQAAAKKDFEDMRAFFEEVRALPPEQRRAAMEQRMNDPAVQERMMERETSRDIRQGPERRIARYKNYIARKESRRNAE